MGYWGRQGFNSGRIGEQNIAIIQASPPGSEHLPLDNRGKGGKGCILMIQQLIKKTGDQCGFTTTAKTGNTYIYSIIVETLKGMVDVAGCRFGPGFERVPKTCFSIMGVTVQGIKHRNLSYTLLNERVNYGKGVAV